MAVAFRIALSVGKFLIIIVNHGSVQAHTVRPYTSLFQGVMLSHPVNFFDDGINSISTVFRIQPDFLIHRKPHIGKIVLGFLYNVWFCSRMWFLMIWFRSP